MTKEKTETKTETQIKKTTWYNRIWSAIVGAVIAIGSMLGITSEQVNVQREKAEIVKMYAADALYSLQKGDINTAIEQLKTAADGTKKLVKDVKTMAETAAEKAKETVDAKSEKAKETAKATETTPKKEVTKATKEVTKETAKDAKTK